MQYFVYMVRCADGTLYTGIATDVQKRMNQHNGLIKGGAKYTKARGPVELVYVETSASRSEALMREHQIKKLDRPAKLELLKMYLK